MTMSKISQNRIAAHPAKAMACVRNTMLEELHAGLAPVTKTGDYSDVFVVDADGNPIPWTAVSHLNDDEMRGLMRQVLHRLFTFQIRCDEQELRTMVAHWLHAAAKWDEPELDEGLSGGSS